jgi:hypothetical protein
MLMYLLIIYGKSSCWDTKSAVFSNRHNAGRQTRTMMLSCIQAVGKDQANTESSSSSRLVRYQLQSAKRQKQRSCWNGEAKNETFLLTMSVLMAWGDAGQFVRTLKQLEVDPIASSLGSMVS